MLCSGPSRGRSHSSQNRSSSGPYDAFESSPKIEEHPDPQNGEERILQEPDLLEPQKREHARLGRPRRRFDPYSPQTRQDVKDVIKALEDLAGQDDPPKEPSRVDPVTGKPWQHGPLRRPELAEIPQSPIFKKQRKKDRPSKTLRSPAEQPLAHDPWARMLAEPIRLCRGSGVRLPISLLTNWSLTKHPTNGEVYLMPTQLADVEKMEKVSQRQEIRWRRKVKLLDVDDKHAPLEENDPVDDLADETDRADNVHAINSTVKPPQIDPDPVWVHQQPATSLEPGKTPAVRVLLYDNLINLFSLTKLRHSGGRVNTTVRLLPKMWLERFEQARHYERNREAFERLTGEKDLSPPTVEATLDLNRLQWQTDIGERLLDILRKRILVAIERTAMLNAQDERRKRRHVAAIPMAKVIALLPSSQYDTLDLNDHRDIPSHGLLSDDTSRSCDPVEPKVRSPGDSIIQGNEVAVDHALAPRFFLYLGPLNSPGLEEMTNPERQAMIPPLLRSPVNRRNQRFPVFPIRAMLGEKFYTDLLELVEIHGYLQAEKLEALDVAGRDYVLMLKASARNEYIEGLLRAVWRLWRYGGGRRWMAPDSEDYEDCKAILDEMHRLQAPHAEKEHVKSTGAGIDEFVREVEEGAMQDQELEERVMENGERAMAEKKRRINKQRE